ncbi:MAG: hypothetical protein JO072_04420 [Parafilimonas sp.]|nr:hypothetical protein [Parafilimonas sp.]
MKALKIILPLFLSFCFMTACNSNSSNTTSSVVNDTTSNNPTTDALDYHDDQRQHIPTPDSSNTIGTDTINGSVATPNTGTQKTYNDKKGNKDSSK